MYVYCTEDDDAEMEYNENSKKTSIICKSWINKLEFYGFTIMSVLVFIWLKISRDEMSSVIENCLVFSSWTPDILSCVAQNFWRTLQVILGDVRIQVVSYTGRFVHRVGSRFVHKSEVVSYTDCTQNVPYFFVSTFFIEDLLELQIESF